MGKKFWNKFTIKKKNSFHPEKKILKLHTKLHILSLFLSNHNRIMQMKMHQNNQFSLCRLKKSLFNIMKQYIYHFSLIHSKSKAICMCFQYSITSSSYWIRSYKYICQSLMVIKGNAHGITLDFFLWKVQVFLVRSNLQILAFLSLSHSFSFSTL